MLSEIILSFVWWQFLSAAWMLWLAGYPDAQCRQILLEEESHLCVSVQSTVAQQSSGSENFSQTPVVFALMWLKYREALKQPL